MHTFYMDHGAIFGDAVTFPPEEALHAYRVLRLSPGDRVRIADGCGRLWEAELTKSDASGVTARLAQALSNSESPVAVTLYQGLPKGEKMEWIVQKAVELGVSRICPVEMQRSVMRINGKAAQHKLERWQRIAREAAKQCGRGTAPEIALPAQFVQALPEMRSHELLIMPWEEAKDEHLNDVKQEHPQATDIGILIGPEGGISREEAESCNALQVTLGPRILRTETAAIAALAAVQMLWGDL